MTTTIDPNNDIIQLITQRKEEGINLLYDRYAASIYGLVFRIVKQEEEAQTILQDTFLKVWERIDQYRSEKGRFITWIFNIARNASLDMLRSKSYRNHRAIDVLDENTTQFSASSYDIYVDGIGIKEMIRQIDPKYRTIIDLIYFNGYTHAEIAKEKNIPLGTVKSRAKKALQLMRKIIPADE